ncbi:MAG: hypothetical protein HND47_20955 [Chloroflexi bacterium]|nr:hypothetical protein [Chloroflexota bacterium]
MGFTNTKSPRRGSDTGRPSQPGRTAVVAGPLGRWDTTALTPGDYQLRLVVVDNQGTLLSPCIVPVRVVPLQ